MRRIADGWIVAVTIGASGLVGIARSLREQVDWEVVRSRTGESPFARTFFVLLEELDIVSLADAGRRSGARIKVMPMPAARAAG